MKLFIQKGYHLGSLALPAKLVYTIFLVFIGTGIWTSWAIYADRIGSDLESTRDGPSVAERYVDASLSESAPAEPAAADGMDIDLPDDEPEPAVAAASSQWPWILDVFHQHLFTVSVVFLILGHLFMLTRLHPMIASVVVLLAGLSSLLHVLAPVIIHKTGGALWLMPVTGATMGLSWTAMVLWTLGAMWLGTGARRSTQA
ncbi:MAG: hypothetical protein R3F39_11500 [Myxococcota bacterium]